MKEDGETLVVRVVDLEDKEALLRSDPDVFFTTPHYDGYPYVLIHLDRVDPEELAELIEEAWRLKQMMGGALRQAGIVAAAGLYALDHNVERLAEDHANARVLAKGLAELPGATLDPAKVDTNIVIFEVDDAPARWGELAQEGVEVTPVGPRRLRAVTHLDVDRAAIDRALEAFRRVLGG